MGSQDKRGKKKERLAKKNKQNKRLPVFVTIRTKRRVQQNNKRRNWRSHKIKD